MILSFTILGNQKNMAIKHDLKPLTSKCTMDRDIIIFVKILSSGTSFFLRDKCEVTLDVSLNDMFCMVYQTQFSMSK